MQIRLSHFAVGFLALFSMSGIAADEATLSPQASMASFCGDLPRPQYSELTKIDHAGSWFDLYTVSPGVTAIYEPHQWQEVISYLIEGSEQALLFDTGNGISDISQVVRGLTDKPITVLNSHTHYDHVGGNYAFETVLGMDTQFTRDRQQGHDNQAIRIEVSDQALCRPLPAGVTADNHIGRPFNISRFIKDGFLFNLGDRKIEVIHIPGHTSDAIALIDRESRLMWTGDSYYSGPIWLFAPETDLTAYRASLQRLVTEASNVDWLLPAHNTPLVEPSVLVEALEQFDAMLAGELQRVEIDEGMVEYRSQTALPFSFLMRDEKLPYR